MSVQIGLDDAWQGPCDRTVFDAATKAGLIKVKRSLGKELVQVWVAAELRDGPDDHSQRVLESVCACCFNEVSGRAILIVLDAQNPHFELGRFTWAGCLNAI